MKSQVSRERKSLKRQEKENLDNEFKSLAISLRTFSMQKYWGIIGLSEQMLPYHIHYIISKRTDYHFCGRSWRI